MDYRVPECCDTDCVPLLIAAISRINMTLEARLFEKYVI